MSAIKFLNKPENSVTRERICFHKLAFDLGLAASSRGYHLRISEPEVDRDGFDITLNDDWLGRHIQVKSVLSTTRNWKVSRLLLRPLEKVTDALREDPIKFGLNGGFLLMEGKGEPPSEIEYFYCDCYTLVSLRCRLIGNEMQSAAAQRILKDIFGDGEEIKIKIPKHVLLKAKSPDAVLGLMGLMYSPEESSQLENGLSPHDFIRYLQAPEDQPGQQIPPESYLTPTKSVLGDKISKIILTLSEPSTRTRNKRK
jgi:hypothetical protein